MKIKNTYCAFTLIEIVVVLVILGVLAAIAVPNLFSHIRRSKASEALATLNAAKTIVENCIQGNVLSEGSCAGPAPVYIVPSSISSASFTYAFNVKPSNNQPNWTIKATGKAALGFSIFIDYITLARTGGLPTAPTFTCTGYGIFAGVC